MAEIAIKGKGLIKKIDETAPEYTGEGGVAKYIPLDGELVCVTDGDNAGLVVGNGTDTVDNCKSVGGGSNTDTQTFYIDPGGGGSHSYDFPTGLPSQFFVRIGNFVSNFPYRDENETDLEVRHLTLISPVSPADLMVSFDIEGSHHEFTFDQTFSAIQDGEEEEESVEVYMQFRVECTDNIHWTLNIVQLKVGNNVVYPGHDSGLQDCFGPEGAEVTIWKQTP